MDDLPARRHDESHSSISPLAKMSLSELQQLMDLVSAQIEFAQRQGDEVALANLRRKQDQLRWALRQIVDGRG